MNCVELVLSSITKEAEKPAVHMIRGEEASFRDLDIIA